MQTEQEHSNDLQKLPHLSLTFSTSFQSLLPRPHSGNHEQHSGETGDDEDSGGFGKSHRKRQPVRGGTPAHLSARVAGAVHTREARPLSTAHAGHLVAGIRPLPHQTQVPSFSKPTEPEKNWMGSNHTGRSWNVDTVSQNTIRTYESYGWYFEKKKLILLWIELVVSCHNH